MGNSGCDGVIPDCEGCPPKFAEDLPAGEMSLGSLKANAMFRKEGR